MTIIHMIRTYILRACTSLRSAIAAGMPRRRAEQAASPEQKEAAMPAEGRSRRRRVKIALAAGILAAGAGSAVYYGVDRYNDHYIAMHTNTLYEVTLEGESLGFVSDPQVIERYILGRHEEVLKQHPDVRMELAYGDIALHEQAIFKGEAADGEVLDRLAPRIHSYAAAVEIRVEGELLGYVKDQATADDLLNRIKQPFDEEQVSGSDKGVVQIASADTETDDRKLLNKQVAFVEDVMQQSVAVKPDQLSDPQELLERIQTGGIEPISHVVQEGDTIYDIARKYDVASEVIYRNNTWIENDMLHPGDILNLTVWQPLLSVQVTKTIEQKEEIPFPIEYVSDPNMLEGQTKVVTPGIAGERIVTIEETTVNGVLVGSHEIKSLVTREPIGAKYLRGTKSVTGLDQQVQKLLGISYVWGGTTTKGFDCSGFTQYVMAKYGVKLPRTSASQAESGTQVAKKDLRKGDLVFFNTFGPAGTITHVAVYMGNGKIANALSTKVQINDLNDDYFSKRYITARRVLSDEQYRAL